MTITDHKELKAKDTGRKELLIKIALERFAKYGYHKTKISDIVGEAGVAQGTFYWYFKSKEALVLEIIRNGQEQLLQVIGQGYRKEVGTVEDMLRTSEELLTGFFRFAFANRHFMEIMLSGSGWDETIRQAAHEARVSMELAFRRNIRRAIELGMLPDTMDVEVRSALLMSLIEGIAARWLFGPLEAGSQIPERTPEELAAETARFEFFGLLGK